MENIKIKTRLSGNERVVTEFCQTFDLYARFPPYWAPMSKCEADLSIYRSMTITSHTQRDTSCRGWRWLSETCSWFLLTLALVNDKRMANRWSYCFNRSLSLSVSHASRLREVIHYLRVLSQHTCSPEEAGTVLFHSHTKYSSTSYQIPAWLSS